MFTFFGVWDFMFTLAAHSKISQVALTEVWFPKILIIIHYQIDKNSVSITYFNTIGSSNFYTFKNTLVLQLSQINEIFIFVSSKGNDAQTIEICFPIYSNIFFFTALVTETLFFVSSQYL